MTPVIEGQLHRTVSRDGTEIGYWTTGEGPPLLLVHGGLGDHTRWDVLRPYLEAHVTVHAMDRRGRSASGYALEYAIERECEDVAAVVDAIAGASASPIDVYCSSYGGLCAFGGAPLTSNGQAAADGAAPGHGADAPRRLAATETIELQAALKRWRCRWRPNAAAAQPLEQNDHSTEGAT